MDTTMIGSAASAAVSKADGPTFSSHLASLDQLLKMAEDIALTAEAAANRTYLSPENAGGSPVTRASEPAPDFVGLAGRAVTNLEAALYRARAAVYRLDRVAQ